MQKIPVNTRKISRLYNNIAGVNIIKESLPPTMPLILAATTIIATTGCSESSKYIGEWESRRANATLTIMKDGSAEFCDLNFRKTCTKKKWEIIDGQMYFDGGSLQDIDLKYFDDFYISRRDSEKARESREANGWTIEKNTVLCPNRFGIHQYIATLNGGANPILEEQILNNAGCGYLTKKLQVKVLDSFNQDGYRISRVTPMDQSSSFYILSSSLK